MSSTRAMSSNLRDKSFRQELNIVFEKEFLIITPDNQRPILATETVRGCHAIMIFHPSRSAILHWDDDTCRLELDKFVSTFLGDELKLDKSIVVTIAGGWKDHIESTKTGDFLVDYFKKTDVVLNIDQLRKKQEKGASPKDKGFRLITLDSRSSAVTVSDDWSKPVILNDGTLYRGEDIVLRHTNLRELILVHYQDDRFPESGAPIYCRDTFLKRRETEATNLCRFARDNQMEDLIKAIDTGITHVNAAPQNAKGWTPLHYACKFKHFKIASLLIDNGADALKTNEAGKTPLDYVSDPFYKRQLLTHFKIIKANFREKPTFVTTFSIFARHPEILTEEKRKDATSLKEALNSEEGLDSLEKALNGI